MRQIEENVVNSFKLAKSDIIQLQNNIIEMRTVEEKLIDRIARLEAQVMILKSTKPQKTEIETITVHKAEKKIYVASKTGKKFHLSNCPFAQNIKPKSKLTFKTKSAPLNQGFRPCRCIK
jgi:hypothetical protein